MSLNDRLLDEALVRRKAIRHGWVYIHQRPTGPPPPQNDKGEALSDLIRDAAVNFDFSPVFAGDRLFAQRVADDFIETLRDYVSADESLTNLTQDDLTAHLLKMWPWWHRSLRSFRDRIHTATKVR